MYVYAVIAIVNEACLASWVLATDPDNAASKASARLPEGGTLKIAVPLCVASLKQFERTQLHELLPIQDGVEFIEFTANNMLFLSQLQQIEITRLSKELEKLKLKRQVNNHHEN